jgi:hypothetical protein
MNKQILRPIVATDRHCHETCPGMVSRRDCSPEMACGYVTRGGQPLNLSWNELPAKAYIRHIECIQAEQDAKRR